MKQVWVWVCVAASLGWWTGAVRAQVDKSIGEIATEASTDILQVTSLISVLFYVVGAILVGVGLLKIKRHSDQPQQVTLGSGLMWILIGVALIVAPWIINAVADTFGTDADGRGPGIKPPKLG